MDKNTIDTVREKHNAPAFHYLLFSADSIIKDISYGYQDITNQIPINNNTSFHAFSTTKTFTAVAILQLVDKGLIKLNDTITDYLPSYDFSQSVTIRNLLCHQSGIANPLPLKWTHLKSEHPDFDYNHFSDSLILKHLKLKRPPGKKYAYSNLNYLVLGKLIEKVSEQPYRTYITDNILQHLPTDEYIGFDIPDINHAKGYHANSWFQNLLLRFLLDKENMPYKANTDWNEFHSFYINGVAYGGLISTPKSLMSYCQALLNGKLLSSESFDEMLTEQTNMKGKKTGMCLSWFKGNLNGREYYCHAGGGGGYYSEIRLYPDLRIGSVIMTNSSGMSDDRILDDLDLEYLTSHEIE